MTTILIYSNLANALEPLQLAEDVEEDGGGDEGDAADPFGSVRGVFEGKAFEVHAVDAGDGQHREGDGAEDGEDLHDLVGAVGDRGEIDIEGVVEEVALSFDRVEKAGDVVVGVADVRLTLGVDDGVGVALEVERGVTGVDQDAAEVDELALDSEDGLQDRGRGIVEDLVLKLIDAVVEVVDGGKIQVDDGVEDEGDKLGGVLVVAVAAGALEGLLGGGAGGIGDGDEEVFAGEDVDGICSAGLSGSGVRRTGLKTAKV
jgi:hypothetical protein